MIEVQGNLWEFWADGNWACITTNGDVNRYAAAVMGRGCAREAKNKFPSLGAELGLLLRKFGNQCYVFKKYRLITFPVKHHWNEVADLKLIAKSAMNLADLITMPYVSPNIYLPRPGCGNGRLDWSVVQTVLESLLSDRVHIVSFPEESLTKGLGNYGGSPHSAANTPEARARWERTLGKGKISTATFVSCKQCYAVVEQSKLKDHVCADDD